MQFSLSSMRRRFAAPAPALSVQSAAHGWLSREEAIMGTAIRVELWCDERDDGESAAAAVMAEMHRIDRLLSPYREDSDLSLINRDAAQRAVPISAETMRLLVRAVRASRRDDRGSEPGVRAAELRHSPVSAESGECDLRRSADGGGHEHPRDRLERCDGEHRVGRRQRGQRIPIGRGDVPVSDGPGDLNTRNEEGARNRCLEVIARSNLDRHQPLIRCTVDEFFAVGTPSGIVPASVRDLPLPRGLRKRLHVDLVAA